MQRGRRQHFEVLDGLRGVAALIVLIGHSTAIFLHNTDLFPRKILAVNFFFMLSGFVISYSYRKRLYDTVPVLDFLVRRAIRLYPLIILGTIEGTAFSLFADPRFVADPFAGILVFTSILSVPGPVSHWNPGHYPINPPQWSLFYEIVAYIAFAVFLQRIGTRALRLFVSFAMIGYAVGKATGLDLHHDDAQNLLSVAASFGSGVLVERMSPRSGEGGGLPFSVFAGYVIAACAVPEALGYGFDVLVVAVIFPALLVLGRHAVVKRQTKSIRLLADLSFPLYILHWPVLSMSRYLLQEHHGPYIAMMVGCVAAIAWAGLALFLFDVPVRARLNAWVDERKAVRA